MANYWVLKPKRDCFGDQTRFCNYWKKFIDERENRGNKVIAIGWSFGPVDSNNSSIADNTIWKFIEEMQKDDEVLICDGYNSQQKSGVLVYGIARITGDYWEDKDCPWFKRKRNIDLLYKIEKKVPKELLAKLLVRQTLLRTIHKIEKDNFINTKKWLVGILQCTAPH